MVPVPVPGPETPPPVVTPETLVTVTATAPDVTPPPVPKILPIIPSHIVLSCAEVILVPAGGAAADTKVAMASPTALGFRAIKSSYKKLCNTARSVTKVGITKSWGPKTVFVVPVEISVKSCTIEETNSPVSLVMVS